MKLYNTNFQNSNWRS